VLLSLTCLARQASAGRLMLCRCYFLSSFFNDRLEQRDLGNYRTDLHQILGRGRHILVDVQSGIGFQIGQGTLPWQPILGAKSAGIGDMSSFLGLAFDNGCQEPLNGFPPNSRGRRVWSFTHMTLNVIVKGHRSRSRSPGTKNALCTLNIPSVDGMEHPCCR